jgi:hypothetical protein
MLSLSVPEELFGACDTQIAYVLSNIKYLFTVTSLDYDFTFYEAQLEAMKLSDPRNCIIRNGTCREHFPRCMLQILSLKLAKIPVDCGVAELYGYIAVRDELDPLLNYVVNLSRDDPIIVEQVHIHTYYNYFMEYMYLTLLSIEIWLQAPLAV